MSTSTGPTGQESASALEGVTVAEVLTWRRLHPLSPVVRGWRVVAGILVFSGISNLRELSVVGSLLTVVAALVIGGLIGFVTWRVTRWRVEDGDLRIETGLLQKRSRRVPLARLQAVDVVRPVLARVLGISELRLEVVGASRGSEGSLAFLGEEEALEVRAELLALAARATAPLTQPAPVIGPDGQLWPPDPTRSSWADPSHAADSPDAGSALEAAGGPGDVGFVQRSAPPAEYRLAESTAGQVLVASLLSVPTMLLLALAAAFLVGLVLDAGLAGAAALGALPALLGLGQFVVRRVLTESGFTANRTADGLVLRHGLLDTRTQTIPVDRIQAIQVIEPLLWRRRGWVRIEVDVAGYASSGSDQRDAGGTNALLPVGTRATAGLVLHHLIPDVNLDQVSGTVPPRRARWLRPLSFRNLGLVTSGPCLVTSHGLFARRLTTVRFGKLQSMRVEQGPVQRRLGLASLHLDTAGKRLHNVAPHRDPAELDQLLPWLVNQARLDRRSDRTRRLVPVGSRPRGSGFPSAPAGPAVPGPAEPVAPGQHSADRQGST